MLKLFSCVISDQYPLEHFLRQAKNEVKSYPGRGYVIARAMKATIPYTNIPEDNFYTVYWTANPNANCNAALEVN